jgi:hypothetical protein
MKATEAIATALKSTQNLLNMYLADLSDADLLVRPVPAANHIAWQLGHLISSEPHLVKAELPSAVYPELPAGFDAQHGKETAAVDPPKGFATKAAYLGLFGKVRQATLGALAGLSDADLDRPTSGPMAKFFPNLAGLFAGVSNHTMMHAGQFTPIRRKLGKPVLF